MRLEGWLLDVRIRDDEAFLWLKSNGKRIQVKEQYNVDARAQEAFDKVWETWKHEQGAMIYAQVVSSLDRLNLTGVLANRREILELRARLAELERKNEA